MDFRIDLDSITRLYRKFQSDLDRVRSEQRRFYEGNGYLSVPAEAGMGARIRSNLTKLASQLGRRSLLRPQLDDLEAEITYLLLREHRPAEVVEISPCNGWSTTWILRALRDNGMGRLTSFDIVDNSTRFVPRELSAGRWTFCLGPAQQNLDRLPAQIDYLFIDSDHSAEFAHWYIDKLFSRLKAGTPVSVHDVYHTADPAGFDGEGRVIVDWLAQKGISYFTPSRARDPESYARIQSVKSELALQARIHHADNNSMIYFRL